MIPHYMAHSSWRTWWVLLAMVSAGFMSAAAQANTQELKLQVQLVWATNDEKSPDPLHKELGGGLARKFASTYRWKKYFEVNSQSANVVTQSGSMVTLSPQCSVELKNLGSNKVEVMLKGKGKPLVRIVDVIQPTEPLIIAGDAQNSTAWFVVISLAR